jgi:hypothetical protein
LKIVLKVGEFFVIKKSESNLSLNNSGDELVTLSSPSGALIDSVSYENAPAGQSYNRRADDSFAWSSTLTPGDSNRIMAVVVSTKKKTIAKPIETEPEEIMEAPVEEENNFSDEITAPVAYASEIAGTSTEVTPFSNPQKPLWPWFVGTFAANVVFCYSLVRLMTRKGNL